jgi:hypothetical protein
MARRRIDACHLKRRIHASASPHAPASPYLVRYLHGEEEDTCIITISIAILDSLAGKKKDAERLFFIEEEDIDELGLPYATAKV